MIDDPLVFFKGTCLTIFQVPAASSNVMFVLPIKPRNVFSPPLLNRECRKMYLVSIRSWSIQRPLKVKILSPTNWQRKQLLNSHLVSKKRFVSFVM